MWIDMAEFHFIRSWWLLAFLPLLVYLLWYVFFQGHKGNWQRFLDPQLANHMLLNEVTGRFGKWLYTLCLFVAGSLVIFSLAGPAWEKIPQPVFKNQSAVVAVLDVSRSMDSIDLKPSRLVRAKQKLNDLLQLNKGGQTALIVYAADAYVVTPLTDDIQTIATHIPNLFTDIVQVQGSRPDKALQKALILLKQAYANRGHVVLLSDSFELTKENKVAVNDLVKSNHRLSIIGIGTAEGAPIVKQQANSAKQKTNNSTGGFVTDKQGNIVIPKLDANSLRKAAQLGGGRYATITAGEQDLQFLDLSPTDNRDSQDGQGVESQRTSDQWNDMGAYLLLLVIPVFLIGFRRGLLIGFCFVFFSIAPVESSYALELPTIFLNNNQQAKRAFDNQQYNVANEIFTQPEWQASAAYKQGNYEDSINILEEDDSAMALYNKGNAYAKLGQLEQAIEQYETSLQSNPENLDAEYNLELVKRALEQQKEQQKQQQGQQEENQQNDEQEEGGQQNQQQNDQQGSENAQNNESHEQQQQSPPDDSSQQDANNGEQVKDSEQLDKHQQGETEEKQDSNTEHAEENEEKSAEKKQVAMQPSEVSESGENKQHVQEWLRRIEDDPGGLLRRKVQYQDYINKSEAEEKAW